MDTKGIFTWGGEDNFIWQLHNNFSTITDLTVKHWKEVPSARINNLENTSTPQIPQKHHMSGVTLSSPAFQAQQRIICSFFAAKHI